MKQKSLFPCVFLLMFVFVSFLTSCGTKEEENTVSPDTKRITNHTFLQTEATGTAIFENESAILDASNSSKGYVMANYLGSAPESRLQITIPDGTVYTYVLNTGDYETIPLTGANGDYQINTLGNKFLYRRAGKSVALAVTGRDIIIHVRALSTQEKVKTADRSHSVNVVVTVNNYLLVLFHRVVNSFHGFIHIYDPKGVTEDTRFIVEKASYLLGGTVASIVKKLCRNRPYVAFPRQAFDDGVSLVGLRIDYVPDLFAHLAYLVHFISTLPHVRHLHGQVPIILRLKF